MAKDKKIKKLAWIFAALSMLTIGASIAIMLTDWPFGALCREATLPLALMLSVDFGDPVFSLGFLPVLAVTVLTLIHCIGGNRGCLRAALILRIITAASSLLLYGYVTVSQLLTVGGTYDDPINYIYDGVMIAFTGMLALYCIATVIQCGAVFASSGALLRVMRPVLGVTRFAYIAMLVGFLAYGLYDSISAYGVFYDLPIVILSLLTAISAAASETAEDRLFYEIGA